MDNDPRQRNRGRYNSIKKLERVKLEDHLPSTIVGAPQEKIATKVSLRIISDNLESEVEDKFRMKSPEAARTTGKRKSTKNQINILNALKSPIGANTEDKESKIRKILFENKSKNKNTDATLQDLMNILDTNADFNIDNLSRKYQTISKKVKISPFSKLGNSSSNKQEINKPKDPLNLIMSSTNSTVGDGETFSTTFNEKSPSNTTTMGRTIVYEKGPSDLLSVLKLAEKKSILIQSAWKGYQLRLGLKRDKIEKMNSIIKAGVLRKIFTMMIRRIGLYDNILFFEKIFNKIYKRYKQKYFLYKLQCFHQFIEKIVENQRKFKKVLEKKKRKTNLYQILKIFDKKILESNFEKMRKICKFLTRRKKKLLEVINKQETKLNKLILLNQIKVWSRINKKLKAAVRFQKVYLYRLVLDFSEYKDKVLQTYRILLAEKNEKFLIDNLEKKAHYLIAKIFWARLKTYYTHVRQILKNSLIIAMGILSKLFKPIFNHLKNQIYSNRYYVDFDENYNTNNPQSQNEFNKVKCRTKNYFLLNLFKIYKAFLFFKNRKIQKRLRILLIGMIAKKSLKEKILMENYFSKYRNIINSFHYRSEGILEKALTIINKNKEKYEFSFDKLEMNLKSMIKKLEKRLTDLNYEDMDGLVEMNVIHFNLVTIQTGWNKYMEKLIKKKNSELDFNQTRNIQLKRMKKMEEMFNYLFFRISKMDFNFFRINLKEFARFGKMKFDLRNSTDGEETQTDLYSSRDSLTRILLQKNVMRKHEKEMAYYENYFNTYRKNVKWLIILEKVSKIQIFWNKKLEAIRIRKIIHSKLHLKRMFSKCSLRKFIYIMWLIRITLYKFFVSRVKVSFNIYYKEISFKKLVEYVEKLQRFVRRKIWRTKWKRDTLSKSFLRNVCIRFIIKSISKIVKLVKLYRFGFFKKNEVAKYDTECLSIIKTVLLLSVQRRIRNYDFLISKMIFIQIFWKGRVFLFRRKKFKETVRKFVNIKLRKNKEFLKSIMRKWLERALRVKKKIPMKTFAKFVVNVFMVKKKFTRIFLRMVKKMVLKKLMVVMMIQKQIKI